MRRNLRVYIYCIYLDFLEKLTYLLYFTIVYNCLIIVIIKYLLSLLHIYCHNPSSLQNVQSRVLSSSF